MSHIIGGWNFHALPNKIREFIFKFVNNTLGLNTRLAHFVVDRGWLCTFCGIQDETFFHLFFQCNVTTGWLTQFVEKFYSEIPPLDKKKKKKFWFLHINPQCEVNNLFFSNSLWIFKYLIWESKLQKKVPSMTSLIIDFKFHLKNLYHHSTVVRLDCHKLNYAICREVR